ncbi:hypothetical protein [Lysinibacillus xylanilyticus]|uniref:hypothetical protein n=1 Tax=Lysinibacillus xylanilyticus TaxID=582475 RepID=UPI003D081E6F
MGLPETFITDGRFPPYIENQSKATRIGEYYRFLKALIELAPKELLDKLDKVDIQNKAYLGQIKESLQEQ